MHFIIRNYYYSLFKASCAFLARFRLKKQYTYVTDGILLTFPRQRIKETVNKI